MKNKFLAIFISMISIFILIGLFFIVKITSKAVVDNSVQEDYKEENVLSINSSEDVEIKNENEESNTIENETEIKDSYDENIKIEDNISAEKVNRVENNTENNLNKKDTNSKKEEQVNEGKEKESSNNYENNNAKSANTTQEIKNESNTKEEKEQQVERCTNNSNHGIAVGNSNEWFNSREEAISYYEQLISDYGYSLEYGPMTREEYNKKCPYGFEAWSCMFCNKWTLNFYFREK